MDRHNSQVSPTNLRSNCGATAESGSTIVLALGQMLAHQQAHTQAAHVTNELLHGVVNHLSNMPEQIALRLPNQIPAPQETKPSEPPGKVIPLLKALKELFWSITPLAMVAAATTGKITWPQALPIIRQALGLH